MLLSPSVAEEYLLWCQQVHLTPALVAGILLLSMRGLTKAAIATQLGVSRSLLYRYWDKLQALTDAQLQTLHLALLSLSAPLGEETHEQNLQPPDCPAVGTRGRLSHEQRH